MNTKNLFEDESGDRQYFAMIPSMLWPDIKNLKVSIAEIIGGHIKELGVKLNVHDRWLYATIKRICGEKGGQCFLNTTSLARLAGMSVGKVSEGKTNLEKAGLIIIISKKRSPKGRPIDHITVVDIWERNIATIKARQKKYEPEDDSSPEDGLSSRAEGLSSPNEVEEEPIEEKPIEEKPISPIGDFNFLTPIGRGEHDPDFPIEEKEARRYKPGPGQVVSCVDPDTGEEVGEPDWRFPQTQIQHQAFNITGRKRFSSKTEYNKMRKIEYKLENSELPHEFWEAQKGCARSFRWSFPILLKSTLNPDRFREWQRQEREAERERKKQHCER